MKGKVKISAGQIASFITVLLAFHYYLSYEWIYGLLGIYGLQHLAIITIEDLLFTFVNVNFTVIKLASLGFLWIFGIQMAVSKEDYAKMDQKAVKGVGSFWDTLKWGVSYVQVRCKECKNVLILIVIISGLVFISYKFRLWGSLELPETGNLGESYFLIFLVIPIIHVIWPQKRTLTMGLYLLMIFLWSNKFVSRIIMDVKNDTSQSEFKTDLQFRYQGKLVSTSDSIDFIYRSYTYIILRNNLTSEMLLYPNDKIEKITYSKRKLIEDKACLQEGVLTKEIHN